MEITNKSKPIRMSSTGSMAVAVPSQIIHANAKSRLIGLMERSQRPGSSYLGTMSNGLATTGVDGLEVIIAEAGISSWYNYYRENGLVTSPGGYPGEDFDSLAELTYSRTLLGWRLSPPPCGPPSRSGTALKKQLDRSFWRLQSILARSQLSLKCKSGQGRGGLYPWLPRLERQTASRL